MAENSLQNANATFEELAEIELEFEDVENIIMAKQYLLSRPIYEKRAGVIGKIPNFWPLAFEMAPPEIDGLIQPSDSDLIANSLIDFSVDRFEVNTSVDQSSTNLADYGTPRSLAFRFEFRENEYFEDRVLEKKFYWRRGPKGFEGLVSTPVKIHWKPGKDLTDGLLDASCKLAEAWNKRSDGQTLAHLQENRDLEKRVDQTTEGGQSFFAWFGYIGQFITDEESKAAWATFNDKRRASKGDDAKITLEDMESGGTIIDSEIFPGGEALATALAEQFWPGALSYFTNTQEDLSEADFMEGDFKDEDINSQMSDDEEGTSPPSKRQRQTK